MTYVDVLLYVMYNYSELFIEEINMEFNMHTLKFVS
jgi:hypothetical protein